MLSGMLNNLQGLQGLQANQVKMDEFQTQRMNRSKATDLLRSYQETQDPAKLNEAILLDGELANNVLAGIGIQDKARMQRAADDYIALTGSLGNKDQFNQLAAQRLDNILAAGGNPSDTLAVVKAYNEQGPEAAKAMLQPVGAALVNKGVLRADLFGQGGASWKGTASIAEFEYYQNLQEKNPKAAEAFGRERGYIQSGREENKTEKQRDYEQWQRLKKAGDPSADAFGRSTGFESRAESQANVSMRQQEAKQGAIDLNAITKESRAARSTLNTLDQLSRLEQNAFENFSGTKMFVSRLAKQAGMDVEGLSDSEAFEAVATGVVLDKAQLMAGALSNADMVFLQNSAPALSQTSEGRKQLIEFGKKLAKRQIEYAQEAAKFRSKNGYFDLTQFETEFRQNKGDLFGDESRDDRKKAFLGSDEATQPQPEAFKIIEVR
jgi:hypothetical protein